MKKEDFDAEASSQETADERADVIREFMALEHRTAATADAYAARLGLGRSRFYRLVQVFGQTRDRLLEPHAAIGKSRLDPRIERKINIVLDRLGPSCRVKDAHLLVGDACRKAGLPEPAPETVRQRLLERRDLGRTSSAGSDVIIDRTGLGMAVEEAGRTVIPCLVVALHMPTGKVIGHRLTLTPDPSAWAELQAGQTSVIAGQKESGYRKGGAASAVFGDRMGPFKLCGNWAGKSAPKKYKWRMSYQEAQEAVVRLIEQHNASRSQSEV